VGWLVRVREVTQGAADETSVVANGMTLQFRKKIKSRHLSKHRRRLSEGTETTDPLTYDTRGVH